MKERKDRYRAALEHRGDNPAKSPHVTTLHSKYVRVTIEVDPDLREDLTRLAGAPLSALLLAGTTVLRAVAATASKASFSSDNGGAGRS
jgi:hypothetical protein